MCARGATVANKVEREGKREERGGWVWLRIVTVVGIAVVRKRQDDAQRVPDAEERAVRSRTEEWCPCPLRRAILLMPLQRPRDGDVRFYSKPSFGMHAFGALARVIARVERNVDPLASREEGMGFIEGEWKRRS
jgi:hypothetical protein